MSDSLSLASNPNVSPATSALEGNPTLSSANGLNITQKPGQTVLDEQKLENLISEKLNNFEGTPGKQQIRQMMKEVVQDLLQGKNGKGTEGQGSPGNTLAGGLKGQVAAETPQGEGATRLGQPASPEENPKGFANLGTGDKPSHRNLGQNGNSMDVNPNLTGAGAMPMPQTVAPGPIPAALQHVQVSREAATQMIADIANQIVDRIQVNTNTLAHMQEVRISFGNTILPNTEVVINLTGNQLNVTFVAGSQQAAQFLSSQNLSQLQNSLKTKLGEDKTVSVSLKKGEKDEEASVATERAIHQKESSGDASSNF